jgi:predicted enzyme related to lactoylglutathione lyase
MSEESNHRGRFVWYDLMTPDPEAAQAFYAAVAGWGTEVFPGMQPPYTMWTANGTPIGGSMTLQDEAVAAGARPHWLAYVAVPDVDATAARAQELGSRILVPPTPIPTVGRFAVLADPQGAHIALFRPDQGDRPEPEGMPPVGDFTWHELATPDPDAAWDFYADLFGWEKTSAMDMGEMGTYQMFGRKGATLGGIYRQPDTMPGPPAWLHYARVPDVNAAVEAASQNGGQIIHGPMEVPGGDWVAMMTDPQGGMFAVHETRSMQQG